MKFEKKPLTIDDQIDLLKSRGMIFKNEDKAHHYLGNISYYRLSAYWYIFLENPQNQHHFKQGTIFHKAIDVYVFDKKLRLLIFNEIERIEISFRTKLIYHFCHEYGNNWYENPDLYVRYKYYDKFQKIIHDEIKKSSEVFIRHYKNKYTDPINPPAWMALELASFGQLSMLYKNLKSCNAKKQVASFFNLDDIILSSWLESLSYVRNTCAHHSRLWNKKLPKSLTSPNNALDIWLKELPVFDKRNRIYLVLASIIYLLKVIVPNSSFNERLQKLINSYPDIPLDYMGFPDNWREEKLWQI